LPTIFEIETMEKVWEIITDSELVRDYRDPVTLNTYRLTYDRRSTRTVVTCEAEVTLI
jgi:hypothetical protein